MNKHMILAYLDRKTQVFIFPSKHIPILSIDIFSENE